MEKVQGFVIKLTLLIAGLSAAFIELSVIFFTGLAYSSLQENNEEIEVLSAVLILFGKYLILIMLITALLAGSLTPLAIVHIILSRFKADKRKR